MTPTQCRQARELLGLTQKQLADMADLSDSTVVEFEAGRALADCLADVLEVTLLAAGVEFISKNGGGPGVRLCKAEPSSGSIVVDQFDTENDE
jgi:DNA-binding XRE family transcriptional regulator